MFGSPIDSRDRLKVYILVIVLSAFIAVPLTVFWVELHRLEVDLNQCEFEKEAGKEFQRVLIEQLKEKNDGRFIEE